MLVSALYILDKMIGGWYIEEKVKKREKTIGYNKGAYLRYILVRKLLSKRKLSVFVAGPIHISLLPFPK